MDEKLLASLLRAAVTQWFPFGASRAAKPRVAGVYEVEPASWFADPGKRYFSHWNGHYWGFIFSNIESAYSNRNSRTHVTVLNYRGLADDPRTAAEKRQRAADDRAKFKAANGWDGVVPEGVEL